jgi:hypothetical protein
MPHQRNFSTSVIKSKKNEAKGSKADKPISVERHKRTCTVCGHEKCAEIEADFVNWKSPALIAEEYGLADRTTVYRHAHALGLMEKRKRNLHAALEKIIEKAGEVEVSAPAVVAAIQAYAKINAQGQWIDRSEHVTLNELFERMSRDELEAYAKEGTLPDWFAQTVGATPTDDSDAEEAEE